MIHTELYLRVALYFKTIESLRIPKMKRGCVVEKGQGSITIQTEYTLMDEEEGDITTNRACDAAGLRYKSIPVVSAKTRMVVTVDWCKLRHFDFVQYATLYELYTLTPGLEVAGIYCALAWLKNGLRCTDH